MSYDIYLHDEDGNQAMVAPFMGGGTVQVNPDTMEEVPQVEAWLNVTYNYSSIYTLAAKAALYQLHRDTRGERGMTAIEARPALIGLYEEGMRYLDGRTASEVRDGLERMLVEIDPRGTFRRHEDYWAPTPGNAAAALRTLVSWCHQQPAGEFSVH